MSFTLSPEEVSGLCERMGEGIQPPPLSSASGGFPRQPPEKLVPYVRRPEEIIPGKPLYYATTFPHRGYGKGVLVRTEMGRPTKIEGNPDHPASLGATDIFMKARFSSPLIRLTSAAGFTWLCLLIFLMLLDYL